MYNNYLEDWMVRKIIIVLLFYFIYYPFYVYSQSEELPRIMFVNAPAGLRIRSEPSISGNIKGILLYGERIIIREKSNNIVTIDGITDYWYRIRIRADEQNWIFGGYISEYLSSDLPIILGLWDDINSPFVWDYYRVGYRFNSNYEFSFFIKETGHVVYGSWEMNDNIIRIFDIQHIEGHISVDYTEEFIQLEIIDSENIVLTFLNNTPPEFVNNNKTIQLRRSPDIWW